MSIKIETFTLLDNGRAPVKNPAAKVLGMDVDMLNLRVLIRTRGVPAADIPKTLSVTAITVEPRGRESVGRRPGKASMSAPFTITLSPKGDPGTYEGSLALTDLAPFMTAFDSQLEVATVVRDGADATSDKEFVRPLRDAGWSQRGAGVQPGPGKAEPTADMSIDRPDAFTLFRAGGAEVLELAVVAQPGQNLAPPLPRIRTFIRSPADIFFYSGHGAWWNGWLQLDVGGHNYKDWLRPSALTTAWEKQTNILMSPMDLDVLIINGCSVLFWNHKNEPVDSNPLKNDRRSYGLTWADLLCSKRGPLFAILGYRFTAPLDAARGNTIAAAMSNAIKELGQNWLQYAFKWMQINAAYTDTWTAAAFDTRGYYYLNLKTMPGSKTQLPCPGYDPSKKEGTIMGPIPVP